MLSLPHLIVLFIVALVIFGPQKLPELARMLGKATAEFRKMTNDFRYALEDEVRELERQTRLREAEAATAASQPRATPAPPEATVAREVLPPETPASTAGEVPPPPAPSPEPVAPAAVTSASEKPSDDHSAV